MMFWIREIAGWLLLILGLGIFVLVYDCCSRERPFDGGLFLIMGIFVFRGGIHLLKVAVAAQAAIQAQQKTFTLEPQRLREKEKVRR